MLYMKLLSHIHILHEDLTHFLLAYTMIIMMCLCALSLLVALSTSTMGAVYLLDMLFPVSLRMHLIKRKQFKSLNLNIKYHKAQTNVVFNLTHKFFCLFDF